ncbi:MAG TPA: glycosyltransferase family 39 protein [Ktedonobacterales bacterium]|nr:glycosyltransferase family 39 protein [Ktedonobacterales bacterium]
MQWPSIQVSQQASSRLSSDPLSQSKPSLFRFSRRWPLLALGLILLLSTFLNFFRLDQLGYGNRFYAAGVKSMLESWHNFFFVSFDPGGFVAIDKPPLGLWIQAASAKLFGFSGMSMLAPEALAGVVSVALLYHLVARTFGAKTGLLAALALAVAPLNVVISRNNTMDMLLVCTLLFATWTIFRAAETGRLGWLLVSAVLLGLAFNIKSLEAYLVVPAFGLLYLISSPRRWQVRSLHLLLAGVVLLIISLSWITIVDLTPASERPYVGSTTDNSEFSLAFGYNGLHRLFGNPVSFHIFPLPAGPLGGLGTVALLETDAGGNWVLASYGPQAQSALQATSPDQQDNIGSPGPFRLFGTELSGQIAWLLPSALLGLLVAAWQTRWRFPLTRQQQSLVLWGGVLLTMGVFFSVADLYNIYYLVIFTPSICALAAIGLVIMWRAYRQQSWRAWFLPGAIVLAAGMQAFYLSSYPGFAPVLAPLVIEVGVLAAAILVAAHLLSRRAIVESARSGKMALAGAHWWEAIVQPAVLRLVTTLAFLALLIAPFVWGSYSVLGTSGIQRSAGPQPQMTIQVYLQAWGNAMQPSSQSSSSALALTKLDRYLLQQRSGATFIVATLASDLAAPIILETGQPVLALGGFVGQDPILSTTQLVNLIDHGTVRFFLFQLPDLGTRNDKLVQWVNDHCSKVLARNWASGKIPPGSTRSLTNEELLDCAHHR